MSHVQWFLDIKNTWVEELQRGVKWDPWPWAEGSSGEVVQGQRCLWVFSGTWQVCSVIENQMIYQHEQCLQAVLPGAYGVARHSTKNCMLNSRVWIIQYFKISLAWLATFCVTAQKICMLNSCVWTIQYFKRSLAWSVTFCVTFWIGFHLTEVTHFLCSCVTPEFSSFSLKTARQQLETGYLSWNETHHTWVHPFNSVHSYSFFSQWSRTGLTHPDILKRYPEIGRITFLKSLSFRWLKMTPYCCFFKPNNANCTLGKPYNTVTFEQLLDIGWTTVHVRKK